MEMPAGRVMGGGSAIVPAHYIVTPLEGIRAQPVSLSCNEMGASLHVAPIDSRQIKTSSGEHGVEINILMDQNSTGSQLTRSQAIG